MIVLFQLNLKNINMSDQSFLRMFFKRRFCKRFVLIVITFWVSYYISSLIFGKGTELMRLTDLHKCPACYGVSLCPELYSNKIFLDTNQWSNVFNVKNVYHGYTESNRRVVLKKLASNWELKEFDQKMCDLLNVKRNCKPVDLLDAANLNLKILETVQFNFTSPNEEPRRGLVLCPYAYSIFDIMNPLLNNLKNNFKSGLINVWTMLIINPEPIILQMIPKSRGWPVPAYGGVCGRLEVVGHEGEPISSLMHVKWHKKLKYALKIINAAMDFTFKHERFRIYLMDWSLDNIVANENDDITFVDLEDLIIVDKYISPKNDLPEWYQSYNREHLGPGFTFSIQSICKSHLSDHNLWAACYILAGNESPLLYPMPKEVNASNPDLDKLFIKCLNEHDRFRIVTKLQHVISGMLKDKKIFKFDAVR